MLETVSDAFFVLCGPGSPVFVEAKAVRYCTQPWQADTAGHLFITSDELLQVFYMRTSKDERMIIVTIFHRAEML